MSAGKIKKRQAAARALAKSRLKSRERLRLPPADISLDHPLLRALAVLGVRVRFTDTGASLPYLVDNRLVDERALVSAANESLALRGEKPIAYPFVAPRHERVP